MNPKATEQVACVETALSAIERPSIEIPAQILRKGLTYFDPVKGLNLHPSNDVENFYDLSYNKGQSFIATAPLECNYIRTIWNSMDRGVKQFEFSLQIPHI